MNVDSRGILNALSRRSAGTVNKSDVVDASHSASATRLSLRVRGIAANRPPVFKLKFRAFIGPFAG